MNAASPMSFIPDVAIPIIRRIGLEQEQEEGSDYDEMGKGTPSTMEDLISHCASEYEKNQNPVRNYVILRGITGMISMFSSVVLIWIIRRSHVGFSSSYQRLLLGLCVGDIVFSLSNSMLNAFVPAELQYYIWNARGNVITCTMQGFLYVLGMSLAVFYLCSLNLYYLAVVKYEKSEEFVRQKIEPFLHCGSIVIAVVLAISNLALKNYNPSGAGHCVSPVYYPPHCVGCDDGVIREGFTIPCERGRGRLPALLTTFFILASSPPIIIGVSLFFIYRAVVKLEQKIAGYGVGSLRASVFQQNSLRSSNMATPQSTTSINNEQGDSKLFAQLRKLFSSVLSKISSKGEQQEMNVSLQRRSSSQARRSRTIWHKAIAYSISYVLSFSFIAVHVIVEGIAKKEVPIAVRYLGAIFIPLQGFYNLVIYLYPTVITIKRKKSRGVKVLSWRQAIVKALWSKGPGDRNSRSASSLRSVNVKKLRVKKRRFGKLCTKKNKNRSGIVGKGQREGKIAEVDPHQIIVASEVNPHQTSVEFCFPEVEEEVEGGHGDGDDGDGDIEYLINGTLQGA